MVATRQATVMISSHNLKEIQELCDHVAILDRGKLVAHGSVEEITKSGRFVRLTLSRELTSPEQQQLVAIREVRSIEPEPEANYQIGLDLTVTNVSADDAVGRLLRAILDMGVTPRNLSEGGSLEEFFLKVTGADPDADADADTGQPATDA
jgi:ABC-2 type transport system ATP-binding protein